jgi:hypothetical protein
MMMMSSISSRSFVTLIGLLFFVTSSESNSSFLRDVIKAKSTTATATTTKQQSMNDELLSKAIPLQEYRNRLKSQGLHLMDDNNNSKENSDQERKLSYYYYHYNDDNVNVQQYNDNGQNNNQQQDEEQVDDDYYVNQNNFMDFDGYSLKYAKCQPVQRFSETAVEAGEYSPMVVNDIVILRLCPKYYCSNDRAFGCLYDYAEYAVELTDYIRIMLRYKMDRDGQRCDWCQTCEANIVYTTNGGRQRRAANNNYYYNYNNDDANAQGDDAAAQGDDNVETAAPETAAPETAAPTGVEYSEGCEDYPTYCLDEYGASVCAAYGQDNVNNGDDGYSMTADEYLDIIACTQINGGYFVRPRCNGYSGTVTMGIYHDRFCSWYAGNEVDIENFGMGIDQSYFEFVSSEGCIDCSQSVSLSIMTWRDGDHRYYDFLPMLLTRLALTVNFVFSFRYIAYRTSHLTSMPTRTCVTGLILPVQDVHPILVVICLFLTILIILCRMLKNVHSLKVSGLERTMLMVNCTMAVHSALVVR